MVGPDATAAGCAPGAEGLVCANTGRQTTGNVSAPSGGSVGRQPGPASGDDNSDGNTVSSGSSGCAGVGVGFGPGGGGGGVVVLGRDGVVVGGGVVSGLPDTDSPGAGCWFGWSNAPPPKLPAEGMPGRDGNGVTPAA